MFLDFILLTLYNEIKEITEGNAMKLTGELKAKVESAAGTEEKKAILAEAGMELTDEELAAVAGGAGPFNAMDDMSLK